MPVRQLALLLGLFCLCLATVGLAWANGNQLNLFLLRVVLRFHPRIQA